MKVTENHHENRLHGIHFGSRHPLRYLLALFSRSRTRPRIKGVILIMFLLLPLTCASTYTIGSHHVSFNVSEPYNSSAKIGLPTFVPEGDSWIYNLEMAAPDDEYLITITVIELPPNGVSSDGWLKTFINSKLEQVKK